MPRDDLSWALNALRDGDRQIRYERARSYYLGDHRMAYQTDQWRDAFGRLFSTLNDNLCPAVIDSVVDRLQITGFDDDTEGRNRERAAMRVWTRNMMDLRSNEVHREALLMGDGYLIVWPGLDGLATMTPEYANQMTVEYDRERPGVITKAGKLWLDQDDHARVNLFYPDVIEQYRSTRDARNSTWVRPGDFDLLPDTNSESTLRAVGTIPNPYGRVPVFHFANKRIHEFGLSELLDVIPLQDLLNKAMGDMAIAMEFASYKQRWATGLEVDTDSNGNVQHPPFQPGVDRILAADSPETRFGQFDATDLGQFLQVQEQLRSAIARVSGTPLHYLFITRGDFPSGEAMKAAEARFTQKLRDRQTAFGTIWREAIGLAMFIDGRVRAPENGLVPNWEDASPRSEREHLETLALKKALGVSDEQLLLEMGYTQELVERMLEARANATSVSMESDGNGSVSMVVPTPTGRMGLPR